MNQSAAVKVALDIDEYIGKREFLDARIHFKIGTEKGSVILNEPKNGGATYTMEADLVDISKIRRILLQIGWRQAYYECSDMDPIWKGF
ncbi:MAG: hypothetical protein FWB90_08300 [Fibromonadales bacterium]|nr:hypothetical protein [Fibromonadales bacterium]